MSHWDKKIIFFFKVYHQNFCLQWELQELNGIPCHLLQAAEHIPYNFKFKPLWVSLIKIEHFIGCIRELQSCYPFLVNCIDCNSDIFKCISPFTPIILSRLLRRLSWTSEDVQWASSLVLVSKLINFSKSKMTRDAFCFLFWIKITFSLLCYSEFVLILGSKSINFNSKFSFNL